MKARILRRGAAALAAAVAATRGAMAQVTASQALTTATEQVKSLGTQIINLATYVIGAVGVGMLVWAYFKRAKGDQGGNDALMGWGISLIVVIILLQVMKAIFAW